MKLISKLLSLLRPKYNLVYYKENGEKNLYTIGKMKRVNQFGNKREGVSCVGVRAWCYNRKGIRSFRYDRMGPMTRA